VIDDLRGYQEELKTNEAEVCFCEKKEIRASIKEKKHIVPSSRIKLWL